MKIGYKLFAEAYSPAELVRQAVRAEAAGFDFVEISDHFHPGCTIRTTPVSRGRSRIHRREDVDPRTGHRGDVSLRPLPPGDHRASGGHDSTPVRRQIRAGLGTGERLNEHVVAAGGHGVDPFGDAARVDRNHPFAVERRLSQLQRSTPRARGRACVRLAGATASDHRGGIGSAGGEDRGRSRRRIVRDRARPGSDRQYEKEGGAGRRYAEVPLSWAPTEDAALQSAHKLFRFSATGWKVQAELPNPVNFEAAASVVRESDTAESFGYGPDPERHLERIREYGEAGFDHLALVNAGPDVDGFFDFYVREIAPALA